MQEGTDLKHADNKYEWLRDRNWPHSVDAKILTYLEGENQKTQQFFDQHQVDVQTIFQELKGRIKEDDYTVPIKKGEYWYYSYIRTGQNYWVHVRKYQSMDAHEEILLDENIEAQGQAFYKVQAVEVSPNHKLLAYTVDLNGSERYTIFIKDLATDTILYSHIHDTFGDVVWDQHSTGIFYIPTGTQWRAETVYYYNFQQGVANLVYKELDPTFWVGISHTSSEQYLVVDARSGTHNEIHYLDLAQPHSGLTRLLERKEGQLYSLTHHQDTFYIAINDTGVNYRLIQTSVSHPQHHWQEVLAHSQDDYIVEVIAYKEHLVIEKRTLGLPSIQVIEFTSGQSRNINFSAESYNASVIFTTFDAAGLRYSYSSLAEPNSVIEYNFKTYEYTTLKVQEIPSGYDASKYETKRIWATSQDGTKIPMSILYRKDLLQMDGSNPAYLYGYGSYGIAIPPSFRISALSLVDRGFVYAIGHIRGGDDLGYSWYEQAKFLTKKRTFEDFIACAHALIEQQYSSAGNISICGGSAGGMLIGYCINHAPHLYKAAVMHVPFVDVLATMLDETLPLTAGEFKEWGNPKDPEYYEYMRSYSPFDNIKPQVYPHVFITAGLYDPRVAYWEPAKFAAKLQDMKTDHNLLLLKTNMDGGHRGKSGRYDFLEEIAEEYAFILR